MVKARKGAVQGKMWSPDVSGDKDGIRAYIEYYLQQIPAVEAQDRPAVRPQIAYGLKPA